MIKIISGKYKGRKLDYIKVKSIRPTQAIVRKSIMDSIMNFNDKRILDLRVRYGGTFTAKPQFQGGMTSTFKEEIAKECGEK